MNIPYSVVIAGKTEEYIKLAKELETHRENRLKVWQTCNEIEQLMQETVKRDINTYVPYSVYSDYEKKTTWSRAVKLFELSQQYLEYAGQYQESATMVKLLEKKWKS